MKEDVVSAGIGAQVATAEKMSTEAAKTVESPVVIVTGASRGIGRAIALSLGKAGCKVGRFSYCYVCLILSSTAVCWSNSLTR